jgi:hypothetical protein
MVCSKFSNVKSTDGPACDVLRKEDRMTRVYNLFMVCFHSIKTTKSNG